MASPQQPAAPPSNPFDGFNSFANVAPQPPQQQHQQQLSPSQRWEHQQQQQPSPTQQHHQQQMMAQQQLQQQQSMQVATGTAGSPQNMMANTTNNAQVFAAAPPSNPFAAAAPTFGVPQQQQHQPQQQQLQPALTNFPHPQQQPHQLVPMAPNAIVQSPWALQSAPAAAVGGSVGPPNTGAPPAAGGQPYDPLGIFGAQQQLVQQPAFQAQQMQQQPHQQLQAQQQYGLQHQQPAVPSPSAHHQLHNEAEKFNLEKHNESLLPDDSEDEGLALIDVELDDDDDHKGGESLEDRRKDGEFFDGNDIRKKSPKHRASAGGGSGAAQSWDRNPNIAPPPPMTPGRHHAEYLAQNSTNGLSSPLPRPELVHHSGYVLSRISFRTVLMRKWKQTFWIQYGPTQLLFFRTFSDYTDWLNNPYHTIKAREFLVKLRVDFVSDLKKSSVMGYQVTQVRRKPYGKNVMLHFKLERWMDYGPTIAAAFAAREEEMMNSPTHRQNGGGDDDGMNTSNDVSALRKIILGCMRNARDAALVASRNQSGMGEAVGYRGRYDSEHQRESRIPSGSGSMGYHQAFSAESSERRRVVPDSDLGTESSQDEVEAVATNAAPPVVDLLG